MAGIGEILGKFPAEDPLVPKRNVGGRQVEHPIEKVCRFEA